MENKTDGWFVRMKILICCAWWGIDPLGLWCKLITVAICIISSIFIFKKSFFASGKRNRHFRGTYDHLASGAKWGSAQQIEFLFQASQTAWMKTIISTVGSLNFGGCHTFVAKKATCTLSEKNGWIFLVIFLSAIHILNTCSLIFFFLFISSHLQPFALKDSSPKSSSHVNEFCIRAD